MGEGSAYWWAVGKRASIKLNQEATAVKLGSESGNKTIISEDFIATVAKVNYGVAHGHGYVYKVYQLVNVPAGAVLCTAGHAWYIPVEINRL